MSTVTTLIKAAEVVNQGAVQGAPIDSRFDPIQLAPQLHIAEESFLLPVVGQEFYDNLIANRTAGICNYNSSNGALQNCFPSDPELEKLWTQHLYAYLSRAVVYESLPYIQLKIKSQGVLELNGHFSQNAGVKGVDYTMQHMRGQLDSERARLVKFLCANKDDYPLWESSEHCDGCDQDEPKDTLGNKMGFVL